MRSKVKEIEVRRLLIVTIAIASIATGALGQTSSASKFTKGAPAPAVRTPPVAADAGVTNGGVIVTNGGTVGGTNVTNTGVTGTVTNTGVVNRAPARPSNKPGNALHQK